MTSKNKVVEIAGIVMELKDITNELKVELSTKQAVLGLENKQLAKQLLQLDQDYKASEVNHSFYHFFVTPIPTTTSKQSA
jgi:Tfp pilus assembly PilM family ATPase